MNGQASVQSIHALEEFKAVLIKFEVEQREALSVEDMAVRRGLEWFQNDLLKQWQSEVLKSEEMVTNAKAELERCKMQKVGDRTPDCTDQVMALKKAKARLEMAESKVRAVKKWSRVLGDECEEYRALSQELNNTLAGEMPKAAQALKRMLDALYAYLETQAPGGGAGVSMAAPGAAVEASHSEGVQAAASAAAGGGGAKEAVS